jgi:carboxyl-terminal processing protease
VRRAVLAGLGIGLGVAIIGLIGWGVARPEEPACLVVPPGSEASAWPGSSGRSSYPNSVFPAGNGAKACATAAVDKATARSLQAPSGSPAALRCDEARRVVTQARTYLASPPATVDAQGFSSALIDWLDPHGLWSASPDSPVAGQLKKRSAELLAELEAPAGSGPCPVADELGAGLAAWVGELRGIYRAAELAAPQVSRDDAFRLVQQAAFEDGPVTRPSRELSAELGRRVGTIRKSYGEPLELATSSTVLRALPVGDEVEWPSVLLAAAVRAYLPQVDPHGGWAPLDEETSLYEIDLEASPPPRLWRKMVRTAVGIRVDEATGRALSAGDVVLSVGDVPTSCLSVEQAEQLAYVDVEGTAPLS